MTENHRQGRANDQASGARSGTRGEAVPKTAAEEVLKEFEEAETGEKGPGRPHRHAGESGDALSPNPRAQESARGE
ncbi:hypothetical protein AB0J21_00095 [Streptomyces sp. NPDC049954]|uniref:hypothetical protein n=1 Tax=Streptomyces sp. NPDC049954 TaxID=3155779 RepID=UPI003447B2B9